jgi:lipopolysaccharide transport system ATP-binding protein
MNEELVITVSQVGKSYRIWSEPASRLISPMLESCARFLPFPQWWRKRAAARYQDFQALRDISFDVRRGEAIGIIGRNGSGKSTLLQIISGTLQPTQGAARVNGRIAALLELGSGFNPEFSGRENVYLNGAVLGLSRQQMDERFADIAAFANIGDFIEQPVRTYSSGMVVRLAFAVAVHVDPDILIVDEALSVGDARFQLKCARAIDAFIKRGVTLLFVSHDASMIKRLCNRAILLEKGRMLYGGLPNDVVNLYSKLIADGGSVEAIAEDITALQAKPSGRLASEQITPNITPVQSESPRPVDDDEIKRLKLRVKSLEAVLASHPESAHLSRRVAALWESERQSGANPSAEFSYGGIGGKILAIGLYDEEGLARSWCSSGESIRIRLEVESQDPIPEPIFAITIKNSAGVEIYGTNTLFSKQNSPPIEADQRREISFEFAFNVMPGNYFVSAGFTHFVGDELVVVHRRYDAVQVEVHGTDHCFGIANLHARITQRDLPPIPS